MDRNINEPHNPYAQSDVPIGPVIWDLNPLRPQWESLGFDEYAAHLWYSVGLTPVLAAAWRDSGFRPEEARMWIDASAGSRQGISPAEASQWRANGFSPVIMKEWREFFAVDDASAWRAVGFTADHAWQWASATSLNPYQANEWARIPAMTPAKAKTWLDEGLVDATEVALWIENGYDTGIVRSWRKTWLKHTGDTPNGATIAAWGAMGFTAKNAAKWHRLGFEPEEARVCEKANISHRKAQRLLRESADLTRHKR